MLKKIIKSYLTFTKKEQRGVVVLLSLMALCIAILLFYNPSYPVVDTSNVDGIAKMLDFSTTEEDDAKADEELRGAQPLISSSPSAKEPVLFSFDPNTVSLEELQQLGFSRKQAEIIDRYRASGGRFKETSDFKKMYVVSEKMFSTLESYIVVGVEPVVASNPSLVSVVSIDINIADSATLCKLKGVGGALARRIIAYRQRLGGFIRYEQLLEVWGMDTVRYEQLRPQLSRLSPHVSIKINQVDYETLRRTPYLTNFQARNIIYYRTRMGQIKDLEQLVRERIIEAEHYEKLKEYIDYSI